MCSFHDEDNINGNAEQQQAASVAMKTTGGNDENDNKIIKMGADPIQLYLTVTE